MCVTWALVISPFQHTDHFNKATWRSTASKFVLCIYLPYNYYSSESHSTALWEKLRITCDTHTFWPPWSMHGYTHLFIGMRQCNQEWSVTTLNYKKTDICLKKTALWLILSLVYFPLQTSTLQQQQSNVQ